MLAYCQTFAPGAIAGRDAHTVYFITHGAKRCPAAAARIAKALGEYAAAPVSREDHRYIQDRMERVLRYSINSDGTANIDGANFGAYGHEMRLA